MSVMLMLISSHFDHTSMVNNEFIVKKKDFVNITVIVIFSVIGGLAEWT